MGDFQNLCLNSNLRLQLVSIFLTKKTSSTYVWREKTPVNNVPTPMYVCNQCSFSKVRL